MAILILPSGKKKKNIKWQYVSGLYILLAKMGISCKLHMNNKRMNLYMLIVHAIHVECANIMVSHLGRNVECNFIYATIGFLIAYHCKVSL